MQDERSTLDLIDPDSEQYTVGPVRLSHAPQVCSTAVHSLPHPIDLTIP